MVQLGDGVREIIFEPLLNLIPENIGLVVAFRPHQAEFAIGNRAVAVVDKALLGSDETRAACHRCQGNDAKNSQSFKQLLYHGIQIDFAQRIRLLDK